MESFYLLLMFSARNR